MTRFSAKPGKVILHPSAFILREASHLRSFTREQRPGGGRPKTDPILPVWVHFQITRRPNQLATGLWENRAV